MGRSSYINPVKPGLFIFAVLLLLTPTADAQEKVRVSGRVYDMSQSNPLEAVSVESSSGGFTITDSLGRFSIIVNETDSIWFSYLQKPTPKYPVNTIKNPSNFEIALHVNMVQLKEVRIVPKNYRLDSIQNRKEYADAFNYKKPGIGSALDLSPGGGVGLDINQLIEMFQFGKTRRMLNFQQRLLREEEEKYIAHRFSRSLIIKLTGLQAPELDTFIKIYTPPIEFIRAANEYEIGEYIQKCYAHYVKYKQYRKAIEGRKEENQ
jgi:hypothetical protein